MGDILLRQSWIRVITENYRKLLEITELRTILQSESQNS